MRKNFAIASLVLIILYALAGFLAAPAIIKPRLVASLEQFTHRSVHLGGLRINPFTFAATLEDFWLLDHDSTRLFSFKELYVRYRITSIYRHVWALAQFRLDTPYVAIRVMPGDTLSVNDLFDDSRDDSSGTVNESPRPLEIGDLFIGGGTIVYQNSTGGRTFTKTMDSLDLSLKEFSTVARDEGTYEFEAMSRQKERVHWRGNVGLVPLRSTGLIELAGVRARTLTDFMGDGLRFEASSGTFSARAEYTIDSTAGGTSFALRNGRLDITDLLLTSALDTLPPVSLPSFHAGGIALEYPRNVLTIDTIRAEGANVRTAYLADGTMTLKEILTPRTNPDDTSSTNFVLLIKKLSTKDFSFQFIDRSLEPEATVALTGIGVEINDLRYGAPGSARVAGSAVLNGGGSMEVNGTLSMDPMNANLDVSIAGSPLVAFQPWAVRHTRAEILGGTFGLHGKLVYAAREKTSDIRFQGSFLSEGGRIRDPVLQEDLLRWGRLELRRVDYRTTPASLQVNEIAVSRPYARVIVTADRTLNLQHLKLTDSTESVDSTITAAKEAVPAALTTIGKVSIQDGSMNFADLTLSPNFDIGIQQLAGTITGLSSMELARADVDLAGQVDNYAPVTITGQINPLSGIAYTDVTMKFEGIDLTTFTPYFSKFAGYKIERGKLTLNLRYKLNSRHLDAENKIVLNQLTLGEKVESPDATSLPVKLAVALLKDSKGVIDLDIPISGSLDDPEFSIFPIVLKALMNVLWKLVTAPFALLGALFGGGGDDLQYVVFMPGVDSLGADQLPKLQALVKGLTDRPGLQLEVKGTSSAPEDVRALAEATLKATIHTGEAGPPGGQDNKRILEVYRTRFKEEPVKLLEEGGAREQVGDSLIAALAWRRLVDSVQVPVSDLRALAQRRAAAVMAYVCQRAGIDPARVFLLEVDTSVKADEGHIRTMMNLTAR